MSAEHVTVARANSEDMADCLALRRRVFVDEQGVDSALEFDGLDAEAVHFIARLRDRLVGTARLRSQPGAGKAERVAVAPEARRAGVGRALMDALETAARTLGHEAMILNAQQSAAPFYARLGYVPNGDPFDEAGIPHIAMRKPLSPPAS